MEINEIMRKYTAEEITLEEANQELAKVNAGFCLNETKNVITPEEASVTTIDGTIKGWGMLNVGIGSLEKVEVIDGKLKHPLGNRGYIYMAGHEFDIPDGETLILVQ